MTTVYDTDGTEAGDVELPDVFETPHRPELIGRAVRTAQANRAQPYGADDYAGMRTPAESFGSGRGMAHVPRSNGQGRRVPQTVGGRPAHPPKEENDRSIKLNDNDIASMDRCGVVTHRRDRRLRREEPDQASPMPHRTRVATPD